MAQLARGRIDHAAYLQLEAGLDVALGVDDVYRDPLGGTLARPAEATRASMAKD